eukprot:CAMPEP_0114011696 /NCGR_PEP_ID=MMETSP0372-20130328/8740_1 /TAXON_ID=340204 /ORGANISM="Lankesteria abbotti" /LENGTH=47 /assembly_acc=CAM_ASM_000359
MSQHNKNPNRWEEEDDGDDGGDDGGEEDPRLSQSRILAASSPYSESY